MSEPVISCIWYPVDDPAQPLIVHAVGRDGITKIEEDTYSPEPYCSRTVYLVYDAEGLRWKLDARNAGVEYAKPASPPEGRVP